MHGSRSHCFNTILQEITLTPHEFNTRFSGSSALQIYLFMISANHILKLRGKKEVRKLERKYVKCVHDPDPSLRASSLLGSLARTVECFNIQK